MIQNTSQTATNSPKINEEKSSFLSTIPKKIAQLIERITSIGLKVISSINKARSNTSQLSLEKKAFNTCSPYFSKAIRHIQGSEKTFDNTEIPRALFFASIFFKTDIIVQNIKKKTIKKEEKSSFISTVPKKIVQLIVRITSIVLKVIFSINKARYNISQLILEKKVFNTCSPYFSKAIRHIQEHKKNFDNTEIPTALLLASFFLKIDMIAQTIKKKEGYQDLQISFETEIAEEIFRSGSNNIPVDLDSYLEEQATKFIINKLKKNNSKTITSLIKKEDAFCEPCQTEINSDNLSKMIEMILNDLYSEEDLITRKAIFYQQEKQFEDN